MAMKKSRAESKPESRRVSGGRNSLPRVRVDEFLEAQQDPKVKQALRDAQKEGNRLRREGLIHD